MTPTPRSVRTLALLLTGGLLLSCEGDPSSPEGTAALEFSRARITLDTARSASVELRNTGGVDLGPVVLEPGTVRTEDGVALPGTELRTDPAGVPTLRAGDVRPIELVVVAGRDGSPGRYTTSLRARAGHGVEADVAIEFRVIGDPGPGEVAEVRIVEAPDTVRQGEVHPIRAEARDRNGIVVRDATVQWSLDPAGTGLIDAAGRFVGYRPGDVGIVARTAEFADTVLVEISERGVSGSFSVVARPGGTERFTSDLRVHGDHAYLGTWGGGGSSGRPPGNALRVWDVSVPGEPAVVDSVIVDAAVVNDVKVKEDGNLGVLTHEGSRDGLNGISLLDLSDPAHPRVISRYTHGLSAGVHNVWIDGDHVYVAVDGVDEGLRIVSISDPANPAEVASFYAGSSFLHDVYVRDGLAFLSHWDAGLVVLDVGNGIAGGSPADPREVSRIRLSGGDTHNAWYWPQGGYVFVGEEDHRSPGVMHVVDLTDPFEPREVATFSVAGATPHNFWLDEEREILYLAWYGNGIRALDVTGELLGELDRQGREIAGIRYAGFGGDCPGPRGGTCAWAPQLHRGLLYVSDMNEGLVVLRPEL